MSAARSFAARHAAWLVVGILAAAAFGQGASTLRWGDGLELVAVSSHLGVAHPPGYPFFTLLVRAALALDASDPYGAAVWVCRIGAWLAACATMLSVRVIAARAGAGSTSSLVGGALFALALLFGPALRPALQVVEVYTVHAAMVATLTLLLLHRGEGPDRRALFGAAAVQGLALSHHLTAVALLPLTFTAVALHARGRSRNEALLAAAIVALLPLLLYASLLLRGASASEERIVWGGIESLRSLFVHLRGGEYAGTQWMMADAHTPFTLDTWAVFAGHRIGMLVRSAGAPLTGATGAAIVVGWATIAVLALGVRASLRARRAMTIAWATAFLAQVVFVLGYNIVDISDYFLALHVMAVPMLVLGLFELARRLPIGAPVPRTVNVVGALVLLLAIPLHAKTARPESARLTTVYQTRLLGALPEGAALVTAESGDLFLLWYTRFAQREREDLVVVPANLLDRPWITATLPPDDPRRAALDLGGAGIVTFDAYVEDLRTRVLDPLLAHGPVFTTLRTVEVLEALAVDYEFRMAAELLRREEIEQLRRDELPRAPSVLWELRRRGP